MGQKLENVRRNLEGAKDQHAESIEKAREDADEMKDIRSMISEIPDDIDTDLIEQVEAVSESATQEGTSHMETEVHGILEKGSEMAGEVIEESDTQSELSEQAAGAFENISDTRFGRSAADAASRAHDTAEQFSEASDEANDSITDAEREYEELLREVEG